MAKLSSPSPPQSPRGKQKDKPVFETTDPRGKGVRLDETALQHIVEGHPEFLGRSDLIKGVIENPLMITSDKVTETTEHYFDWDTSEGVFGNKWVQVPVSVGPRIRYVKTAILRPDIPKGIREYRWLREKTKR